MQTIGLFTMWDLYEIVQNLIEISMLAAQALSSFHFNH